MKGILVVLAFASSKAMMITLVPARYCGDASRLGMKSRAHASPARIRAVDVVS